MISKKLKGASKDAECDMARHFTRVLYFHLPSANVHSIMKYLAIIIIISMYHFTLCPEAKNVYKNTNAISITVLMPRGQKRAKISTTV